jgi:hypothetical protein
MAEKANIPTKIDLVRKAMGKLGDDAGPTQLQDYVKRAFGVSMTTDHVSNYKGKILRAQTGKKKSAGKKKTAAKPKVEAHKVGAHKVGAHKAGATRATVSPLSLHDVETTRSLLGRIGPAQLRGLIDLLD